MKILITKIIVKRCGQLCKKMFYICAVEHDQPLLLSEISSLFVDFFFKLFFRVSTESFQNHSYP